MGSDLSMNTGAIHASQNECCRTIEAELHTR
jgi:hypothetical protein